jgi:hypothetical protein
MKRLLVYSFFTVFGMLMVGLTACAGDTTHVAQPEIKQTADAGGLILPAGFTSNLFAENTGSARHLAITTNGDVYVKLGRAKGGKGIVKLHDANGDGKADEATGFGNYGGTGIAISKG